MPAPRVSPLPKAAAVVVAKGASVAPSKAAASAANVKSTPAAMPAKGGAFKGSQPKPAASRGAPPSEAGRDLPEISIPLDDDDWNSMQSF